MPLFLGGPIKLDHEHLSVSGECEKGKWVRSHDYIKGNRMDPICPSKGSNQVFPPTAASWVEWGGAFNRLSSIATSNFAGEKSRFFA